MKELKIQCSCGKTFEPPGGLLKLINGDGVIELYYLCPHCKKKHHVCFINNDIIAIQKMIDKARERGAVQTCRVLCAEKKILMDKLNGR